MPDSFLPSPALYLIATPIGHLRDITLRALDVLKAADLVLCEDTRHSGKLLKHYDIKASLMPYHDHSSETERDKVISHLKQGKVVALISDAGTPMIADPGYKLVREVISQGLNVSAIPGPNAALTALQLSGVPCDLFTFCGFFPRKEQAQLNVLNKLNGVPSSLIFYETGPRLIKTLQIMQQVFGDRQVAVARELTKMHEQVVRGTFQQVLAQEIKVKGEFVIVVGEPVQKQYSKKDVEAILSKSLETMRTKEAAKLVAHQTGWSVQEAYKIALDLKE